MKIGLIFFRPLLFFLPFSISFCFFRWFRFHFVDFVSFRFVFVDFVSFSLISFRFYFVSHFIGTHNSVFNLHFMKVSTENDNNFGYEKITIVVDNIPLISLKYNYLSSNINLQIKCTLWHSIILPLNKMDSMVFHNIIFPAIPKC